MNQSAALNRGPIAPATLPAAGAPYQRREAIRNTARNTLRAIRPIVRSRFRRFVSITTTTSTSAFGKPTGIASESVPSASVRAVAEKVIKNPISLCLRMPQLTLFGSRPLQEPKKELFFSLIYKALAPSPPNLRIVCVYNPNQGGSFCPSPIMNRRNG